VATLTQNSFRDIIRDIKTGSRPELARLTIPPTNLLIFGVYRCGKKVNLRKLFIVGLVLASVALTITAAVACGDKLMLFAGGGRFRQVYARTHPASILAYVRQNSAVPGVVTELERQPALKQAGYKFFAVEDSTKLDEALKNGKYDLVLLDVADADGVEQQVRSAPSMPVVLPVVYKSTKAEAATVEKKFHCILKAPGSADRYLAALDEAMTVKSKGGSWRPLR
jgi:CheY-like chemotaxis protein